MQTSKSERGKILCISADERFCRCCRAEKTLPLDHPVNDVSYFSLFFSSSAFSVIRRIKSCEKVLLLTENYLISPKVQRRYFCNRSIYFSRMVLFEPTPPPLQKKPKNMFGWTDMKSVIHIYLSIE